MESRSSSELHHFVRAFSNRRARLTGIPSELNRIAADVVRRKAHHSTYEADDAVALLVEKLIDARERDLAAGKAPLNDLLLESELDLRAALRRRMEQAVTDALIERKLDKGLRQHVKRALKDPALAAGPVPEPVNVYEGDRISYPLVQAAVFHVMQDPNGGARTVNAIADEIRRKYVLPREGDAESSPDDVRTVEDLSDATRLVEHLNASLDSSDRELLARNSARGIDLAKERGCAPATITRARAALAGRLREFFAATNASIGSAALALEMMLGESAVKSAFESCRPRGMARWNIHRTSSGTYKMTYRNLVSGTVHECGETRGDTPVTMMVDWIIKIGEANPGDVIVLPDRSVLQLALQPGKA